MENELEEIIEHIPQKREGFIAFAIMGLIVFCGAVMKIKEINERNTHKNIERTQL